MEYKHKGFEYSNNEGTCGENSFEMNKREGFEEQNRIQFFQLKSPSPELNLTAQQHFNNKSRENQHTSGNNILTNEKSNSPSNSYNQRSLLNFGVQREFSELDQFLKETYEKHGIYDLIRSFVDMEDQLVSTFEYLKKLQEMKNAKDDGKKHDRRIVSCFEQIDEVDQFSFEAQENIIHQFLYNLQKFFIPQNNEKPVQEQYQSNAEYSFSAKKPFNHHMITEKKNSHIHTSRSKHAIRGGLKSKRTVFSDQKIVQNISINRPITPLKFEQPSYHFPHTNNKLQQQTIKKTHSQIISEDIQQSENDDIQTQQELLKIIFDLRQEILRLNNKEYGQSESNPSEPSFCLDVSRSQRKFRSKMDREVCQREKSVVLGKSRSILQGNEGGFKQLFHQSIINSFTQPLVIKQDVLNEDSQSNSAGSIYFSIPSSVKQQGNKENNPNLMNVLGKSYEKRSKPMIKGPQTLYAQFKEIVKTESHFLSSHRDNDESQFRPNNFKTTQSQTLSNVKSNTYDVFLDRYYENFKRFFNIELQIQLILVKLITKKLPLKKQFHRQFAKVIKYYSSFKMNGMTRIESVEKFIFQALDMKNQLLDSLKLSYQDQQNSLK